MDLDLARRVYARQMLAVANAGKDQPLEDALSTVARERFLRTDIDWRIMTPWAPGTDPYVILPSRDPTLIYQDVVVSLDAARGVNNGSPSLHARWMHLAAPRKGEHVVHLGAGTGYYSAVLAELVGEEGRVTAVEIDSQLATVAKAALRDRTNVEVIEGSAFEWPHEPADVIYVNFAVSKPASFWIENLKVGGRLVFPLGVPESRAGINGLHAARAIGLIVTRTAADYDVMPLGPVVFVFAEGAGTDPSDAETVALAAALEKGGWEGITALMWKVPFDTSRCWFTGADWGLVSRGPTEKD